jgi:hypothetical protein
MGRKKKVCLLKVDWDSHGGRGPRHVEGPAFRLVQLPVGAEGKYGPITKYTSDWARVGYEKVADCAVLERPRQSGHEIEGRVRIRGRSYSAFTSGGSSDDPGMIIVRSKRKRRS